jgi:hypothetical protein
VTTCNETVLVMARRDVREGAARVTRQDALISALDRANVYRAQAALAREILASLHASLNLMIRQLEAIEERSKR